MLTIWRFYLLIRSEGEKQRGIRMLVVKTLGKFEVLDGVHDDNVLRSDMLKKLLIYLLLHRDHAATIQELSEALWQEDEVDNPAGALKNLMYRLRTLLKKALGDEQYIITSQGAYGWNSKIEIDFDERKFKSNSYSSFLEERLNLLISDYDKLYKIDIHSYYKSIYTHVFEKLSDTNLKKIDEYIRVFNNKKTNGLLLSFEKRLVQAGKREKGKEDCQRRNIR